MVMLFKFLPEDFLLKIFVTSKKIYIFQRIYLKNDNLLLGALYTEAVTQRCSVNQLFLEI